MEKTVFFLLLGFLALPSCEKDYSHLYTYSPPLFCNDGIEVGTLGEAGMEEKPMAEAVGRIYSNKYDQVHSMLVYKDGLLVFEEYMEGNRYAWDGPYYYGERIQWHRDSLHMIMSCTKSVTSAIIGMASDMGCLNVNDPIFKWLPDHQQFNTGGRENITVEHLLTMTSGLEWDEWSGAHGTTENDIDRIYIECQEDPLSCILGKEMTSAPGEKFTYSGGNMIILGEILRNATGRNILDFGQEYLFKPLGIDSVSWYHFNNGVYACDGSLIMTPRDMLKIGITFLNDGVWDGNRIVSDEWVRKSRTNYKNNSGIRVPLDDTGKNGYGYTWWTNSVDGGGRRYSLFQASGWGGQEIIVVPDLEMVVVFTGGNYAVKKHIHEILGRFIIAAVKRE
jgi:CubicO group peptidase (beta-lactamase class C family)